MKKILVVSAIAALGLTSVAFAGGLPEEMPAAPAAVAVSDSGIYLGLEGGWGLTNWKNSDFNTGTGFSVSKDNGFVGRVLAGYQINKYFAVEAGYSYYFNKASLQLNGAEWTNVKTQSIDLLLKLIAPVVENFDLYGKVGPNYMMTKVNSNNYGLKNGDNFGVTFGFGADYSITPNVIANVEWLRNSGYQKVGNESYQPNTDAFMIGLRYKFDL